MSWELILLVALVVIAVVCIAMVQDGDIVRVAPIVALLLAPSLAIPVLATIGAIVLFVVVGIAVSLFLLLVAE